MAEILDGRVRILFSWASKDVLQWNLAIPATLWTNESGWISEVAGFQGTLLMYKRMDQSFGAWKFGCNNEVADIQRPRKRGSTVNIL